ncbi:MAG: T9SS type A sorting domain-containing protein [Paludibacteraceae bacterium]
MKKIKLTLLILLVININALATSDSIAHWDYASRIIHGATNEVSGITSDDKGNIYYSGYGYEVGSAKKHAFIAGKMNETLGYVWKREYFGTPKGGTYQILVDSNSVYITGEFINSLTFPNDTFTTVTSNNPEIFFVCLDANNGDVKWARNLGRREGVRLHFDGNDDLVLAYAAIKGDQIYDEVVIGTVNTYDTSVRGYAYLTLNKTDGTIKSTCFGLNNILASQTLNQLVNRDVKSFVPVTGYIGWTPYVANRVRTLDLNTNTFTTSTDSIIIKSKNNYFRVINTLYHPQDKSWTIFLKYNNDTEIFVGGDTVRRPTIAQVTKFNVAVRLDSTLKMINHLNYNNTLEYAFQTARDSTLLFSFGADGDGYLERNGIMDTVVFKGGVSNYQKGYFVAKSNLDFENFTFNRFSVADNNAGWQTGMIFKGIDIDTQGNIYAAAFHENDIIALPYTIKAASKSWHHLSVIAKFGYNNDQHTSIWVNSVERKNLPLSAYPNPNSGTFYVKGVDTNARTNLEILDIQGKLIYNVPNYTANEPITLALKQGLYFLRANTEDKILTTKFVIR